MQDIRQISLDVGQRRLKRHLKNVKPDVLSNFVNQFDELSSNKDEIEQFLEVEGGDEANQFRDEMSGSMSTIKNMVRSGLPKKEIRQIIRNEIQSLKDEYTNKGVEHSNHSLNHFE